MSARIISERARQKADLAAVREREVKTKKEIDGARKGASRSCLL